MREAYWSIHYASEIGSGFGLIAFDTGTVVGADAAGGVWDGTYNFNGRTGLLDIELSVKFPPAAISTVSGKIAPDGHKEIYKISLPDDLGKSTQSKSRC